MSKGEKFVMLFTALLLCAAAVLLLAGRAGDGYTISALPETDVTETAVSLPGREATERIDLNTATAEELMTLPGIGEARAKAILALREEKGAFTRIEDIMEVSGIGESTFEGLRDRVTVDGE